MDLPSDFEEAKSEVRKLAIKWAKEVLERMKQISCTRLFIDEEESEDYNTDRIWVSHDPWAGNDRLILHGRGFSAYYHEMVDLITCQNMPGSSKETNNHWLPAIEWILLKPKVEKALANKENETIRALYDAIGKPIIRKKHEDTSHAIHQTG